MVNLDTSDTIAEDVVVKPLRRCRPLLLTACCLPILHAPLVGLSVDGLSGCGRFNHEGIEHPHFTLAEDENVFKTLAVHARPITWHWVGLLKNHGVVQVQPKFLEVEGLTERCASLIVVNGLIAHHPHNGAALLDAPGKLLRHTLEHREIPCHLPLIQTHGVIRR